MKKRSKLLWWALFFAYLLLLTYLMFFAEMLGRTQVQREYCYNLKLFKEINRFITYQHILGFKAVFMNLAGNVIGFMPFGFMLPVISSRAKSIFTITLLSFCLSLGIEAIQIISKVGSFDVDDLLLNTIGGLLGAVVFFVYQKIRSNKNGR